MNGIITASPDGVIWRNGDTMHYCSVCQCKLGKCTSSRKANSRNDGESMRSRSL
jgi:hypothetical protein